MSVAAHPELLTCIKSLLSPELSSYPVAFQHIGDDRPVKTCTVSVNEKHLEATKSDPGLMEFNLGDLWSQSI